MIKWQFDALLAHQSAPDYTITSLDWANREKQTDYQP